MFRSKDKSRIFKLWKKLHLRHIEKQKKNKNRTIIIFFFKIWKK